MKGYQALPEECCGNCKYFSCTIDARERDATSLCGLATASIPESKDAVQRSFAHILNPSRRPHQKSDLFVTSLLTAKSESDIFISLREKYIS